MAVIVPIITVTILIFLIRILISVIMLPAVFIIIFIDIISIIVTINTDFICVNKRQISPLFFFPGLNAELDQACCYKIQMAKNSHCKRSFVPEAVSILDSTT